MKRPVVLVVAGRKVELDAPGLKFIKRAAGRRVPYWAADERAAFDGYTPRTVRLNADLDDLASVEAMAVHCRRLQAEMYRWTRESGRPTAPVYDYSVRSLIELYKEHPASPFQRLKPVTRDGYLSWLKTVEQVGDRSLIRLKAIDFRSWYDKWRAPAEEGGPERIRRAYAAIQMLRMLLNFGATLELKDCVRLADGLARMEFETSKPRESFMTVEQAEAFLETAIAEGQIRIALGHACQFELMLRQGDVIGQWDKLAGKRVLQPGEKSTRGRVWHGGLTFESLDDQQVLTVKTSKRGRAVTYDLKLYPMVQRCLALINDRSGPFVTRPDGEPYDRSAYSKAWRRIADAAGIPKGVWNMDNRASGVTEAREAGASMDDVSKHAAHASPATTRRIYDRSTGDVTARVAKARSERRTRRERGVVTGRERE